MCLGAKKTTRSKDYFVRPVQLSQCCHDTAAQCIFRQRSAIPQSKIVKKITHCSSRDSGDFLFAELATESKCLKKKVRTLNSAVFWFMPSPCELGSTTSLFQHCILVYIHWQLHVLYVEILERPNVSVVSNCFYRCGKKKLRRILALHTRPLEAKGEVSECEVGSVRTT